MMHIEAVLTFTDYFNIIAIAEPLSNPIYHSKRSKESLESAI